MFTGIIEELGVVESFRPNAVGARMRIRCKKALEDAKEGESISVNGVCLTAVDLQGDSFAADLAPETLERSNLGDLREGSRVNLERSVQVMQRLSGHIVQGHVDTTAKLIEMKELGDGNWWLSVQAPQEFDRYIVYKGSIAIDGISLTVASIDNGLVGVTIIPHTYANTSLGFHQAGDRLNIECDILAKHVEKLLIYR
jgi:riboflavin synthase